MANKIQPREKINIDNNVITKNTASTGDNGYPETGIKTTGVKTRGNGVAIKGCTARGPMA